jgi:hypothetical protein
MNRFPTTGAGATAQVTLRLTRAEVAELDRFCAERKLTRSQVARRRAVKAYFLERAGGPKS